MQREINTESFRITSARDLERQAEALRAEYIRDASRRLFARVRAAFAGKTQTVSGAHA